MPLPRRLRSFSLRTLMVTVGVTCVLAAWVASARQIVLERQMALRHWKQAGGVGLHSYEEICKGLSRLGHDPQAFKRKGTVSRLRRLLGDVDLMNITFTRDPSMMDLETAARLFPEAYVNQPSKAPTVILPGILLGNPVKASESLRRAIEANAKASPLSHALLPAVQPPPRLGSPP